MKKSCLAAIATSLLAAFTMEAQVQVTQIPGYFVGDGEFNIFPVIGGGYDPSVVVGGGYETFCLSRDTSITIPGLYYETVDTNGVYQPDNKLMTLGTAWLYSQFAGGTLSGYRYGGFATPDPLNPAVTERDSDAFVLQRAIWTLEGTYSYGSGSLADDLADNAFLNTAATFFGGGTNGLATAMLPYGGGLNVGALNMNEINLDGSVGSPVQPMLTLITNTPPPPPPPTNSITGGDTATIGFWHNKNGQALINAMPKSPALGNWLAGNFPCLYGNLAGKSDSAVAAQFMAYFNVKGQKTYAQVMGAALACYVTSSSISGTTAAKKYGFKVSVGGTGAKTYNVGPFGAYLGLSNNTSYTVLELLQAADANCPFDPAVFNVLNVIFSDINQTGDII